MIQGKKKISQGRVGIRKKKSKQLKVNSNVKSCY